MPQSLQRLLPLPVAANVRLVPVDKVRSDLGEDAESVGGRIDAGEFIAFNIAASLHGKRELRLWSGAPAELPVIIASAVLTTPEHVLEDFPMRTTLLEQAWMTTDHHIRKLIAAGELRGYRAGREWRVCRRSAAEFLQRRIQ